MPAKTVEYTGYTAYCPECDWESDGYDHSTSADKQAIEHNKEAHS